MTKHQQSAAGPTKSLTTRLWALALPLMLANSSVALLGIVDTAVIGHLDSEIYLAGVALAAVLFDFLYWGVTFLRMGTTGVVAQAYGAAEPDACRDALFDALLVALLIALVMIILGGPISRFGLSLLAASVDAKSQAAIYFDIKIWGAPGVLTIMVSIGWLIGMQDARSALLLTAVPSVINAALDFLFVIVFDMGVAGAATGSLLSAYIGAALGLYLAARLLRRHPPTHPYTLYRSRLRRFLHLNVNILIRTLCVIFAFAVFARQGAAQGDVILAANVLLLNFQMLLALALDGYANALEVLVGQAIGGRRRAEFLEAIRIGTRWSVVSAVGFALLYLTLGRFFIAGLTDIEAVRQAAGDYRLWMVVSPLIAVWCFVLDGVFIGATQGKAMRDSMLFAAFVVYLPAVVVAVPFGNHGLWFAFMCFFAARGVSLGWLFFRIDRSGGFIAERDADYQ